MKRLIRKVASEFIMLLDSREKVVFLERIYTTHPLTLSKIAEKLNVTSERVRQIETRVLKKAKEFFRKELPDFDKYHVFLN